MDYRLCRILTENLADVATLTSSVPAVASMPLSNLKDERMSKTCRIPSNEVTLTVLWPSAKPIGMVCIPACSLGASSVIQMTAYSDSDGTNLLADTGLVHAAPGTNLGNFSWSQQLNVNLFADGAAPIVAKYFAQHVMAKCVRIYIKDPNAAFLDLSRLVVGQYFAPKCGADYGATTGRVDTTKNTRMRSGDVLTDWGPKYKKLNFSLGGIDESDRNEVFEVIMQGIGKTMFISLLAEDENPARERQYSCWGKTVDPELVMAFQSYDNHSASFQIESV